MKELVKTCETSEFQILEVLKKEWLCRACLHFIKCNKFSPQSDANNLKLPLIPKELQGLTTLEERLLSLLSQRYPFMKLIALPSKKQNAIKGAVVNIPVEVQSVAQTLPRTPSDLY